MSNNSTYASILTSLIGNLSLYTNFITIIVGTIGGICNLITYTAPRLRENACVFYLLCATVFEIFSILVIVPTRIAMDNFGNNLERQSIIFCKFRYFVSIAAPKLVTYYILLAIFDRCLITSSNAGIRSWSQLKFAHRSSAVLFIIGIISGIHILISYNISNNNCQISGGSSYTYVIMTSGNLNKNENQLAAENFAVKLGFTLYYFSFATSFYLSSLTRKFFRNIFCKRVCGFYRRCQRLIC